MEYYVTRRTDSDELMHYGVLGMKWGHRKAVDRYGGSITKDGKYRASNGVVITKSKNAGVSSIRRFSTTVPGRALSSVGRRSLAKSAGRSIESIKAQEKREREALKEYYKVGGDKILSKNASTKSKINESASHLIKEASKRLNDAPNKRRTNKELRKEAKKQSYIRAIGRTTGREVGIHALTLASTAVALAKDRPDIAKTIETFGPYAIKANHVVGAADLGRTFMRRNGLI